jgi:hypothetical protein
VGIQEEMVGCATTNTQFNLHTHTLPPLRKAIVEKQGLFSLRGPRLIAAARFLHFILPFKKIYFKNFAQNT